MKKLDLLYIDTNSQKIEVDTKFFEWARLKMDVASLVKRL